MEIIRRSNMLITSGDYRVKLSHRSDTKSTVMANGSYQLSCVDSEWVEISQTFGTQK